MREWNAMYRIRRCTAAWLSHLGQKRKSILKIPTNRVCESVFETIRCQMDDLLTVFCVSGFGTGPLGEGRMTWTIFNFSLGLVEDPLRSSIFRNNASFLW